MRILVTTIFVGALVAVAACGDDDDTTGTTTPTPAPTPAPTTMPTTPPPSQTTPTPTFTDVYAIITNRCISCHFTSSGIGISLGHLDMSTQANAFSNLVNVPAGGVSCGSSGLTRVVPGNANASLLYNKVAPGVPAPCGDKMPLALASLSQAETDTISGWINGGANNN